MIEWILASAVAALGIAGLAVTIFWPFERPHDPYAASFGDLPKLPAGSLDRGDCA